jgi:hypothetical protein
MTSDDHQRRTSWIEVVRTSAGAIALLYFFAHGAGKTGMAASPSGSAGLSTQAVEAMLWLVPLFRGWIVGMTLFFLIVAGPELAIEGYRRVSNHG